ncbi:MAG: hypothetical protein O6949_04105 [Chloroflexi bacterium]|nr:hypothetical protein [Chloroflexota bacterium]
MSWNASLTTAQIQTIFEQEVKSAGGKVTDTFDDGTLLFTRAVLPKNEKVARRDRVDKGVALKAAWEDIWVHPYVFRRVCINGAIVAQAVATKHVMNTEHVSPIEMEIDLRESVRMCIQEQDFEGYVEKIKRARGLFPDPRLTLMPHLSRLPADQASQILEDTHRRFAKGADESRYGLINAVTSLARDTRNPELRWSLETIGGALIVTSTPTPSGEGSGEMEVVR